MICSKCGNEYTEGSGFCPYCGNVHTQYQQTQYQQSMQSYPTVTQPVKKKTKLPVFITAAVLVVAVVLGVAFVPGLFKDDKKQASEASGGVSDSLKVGEYITFGTYEQDGDLNNGQEPIEWYVLEVQGSRALVISKYVLDYQEYNEKDVEVTWETCTLRQWLNDDFYNTAFTEAEKAKIPTVTVTAAKNPYVEAEPGNDTEDKVFLMGVDYYYTLGDERWCKPTAYAMSLGCDLGYDSDCCWWWLRSTGGSQRNAAYISYDGDLGELGHSVDDEEGVRPAMWIELD